MSLLKIANDADDQLQHMIAGMNDEERARAYEGVKEQEGKRLNHRDATLGLLSGILVGGGYKGRNLAKRMKKRKGVPNAPKMPLVERADEVARVLETGFLTGAGGAALGYGGSRAFRGEPNTEITREAEKALMRPEVEDSGVLKMAFELDDVVDSYKDPKLERLNNASAKSHYVLDAMQQRRRVDEERDRGNKLLSGAVGGSVLGGASGSVLGKGKLRGIGGAIGAGAGALAGGLLNSKRKTPMGEGERQRLDVAEKADLDASSNLFGYMDENNIEWPDFSQGVVDGSLMKMANQVDELYLKDEGDERANLQKAVFAGDLLQHATLSEVANRKQDDKNFNRSMGALLGGATGAGVGSGVGALVNKIRRKPKAIGALLGGVSGMYGGGALGSLIGASRDVEDLTSNELEELTNINQYKYENMKRLQDLAERNS